MNRSSNQSGFISLLAVLITGAVVAMIILGLLMSGVTVTKSGQISVSQMKARNLAHSCAEEALQQIHDDAIYVGTSTVNLGSSSCSYTVTHTGQFTRRIDAAAAINNVHSKVAIYATIGISSISITSWQEVAD